MKETNFQLIEIAASWDPNFAKQLKNLEIEADMLVIKNTKPSIEALEEENRALKKALEFGSRFGGSIRSFTAKIKEMIKRKQ